MWIVCKYWQLQWVLKWVFCYWSKYMVWLNPLLDSLLKLRFFNFIFQNKTQDWSFYSHHRFVWMLLGNIITEVLTVVFVWLSFTRKAAEQRLWKQAVSPQFEVDFCLPAQLHHKLVHIKLASKYFLYLSLMNVLVGSSTMFLIESLPSPELLIVL